MPKAYWVTTYREIKDPAKLAAYAKLAPHRARAFWRALSLPRQPECDLRGRAEGAPRRLRISQPRKGDRRARQPGLAEALRALGDGAVRDVRIIEGLE